MIKELQAICWAQNIMNVGAHRTLQYRGNQALYEHGCDSVAER